MTTPVVLPNQLVLGCDTHVLATLGLNGEALLTQVTDGDVEVA